MSRGKYFVQFKNAGGILEYETKKDLIHVGETRLILWKDIAAIGPDVSGVGYYRTTFMLPEDWDDSMGAELRIGSVNENTAAIYMNGKKASPVDVRNLCIDISELVQKSENHILAEVTSTLNNRLLQRGYFDSALDITMEMMKHANNAFADDLQEVEAAEAAGDVDESDAMTIIVKKNLSSEPHDYGMTGKAAVVSYKKVAVSASRNE